MAIVSWTGNGQNISQIDTGTCSGATNAASISATINGKTITYTMTGTDTNSTAVSGLLALLQASTVPPEFTEITWTSNGAVLTATSTVPGTPFTLTLSGAGGATFTQAHPQLNVSQSDVGNAANWNRAGSAAIPVNGDTVVLKDSSVPLLWNLTALAAVQFASYTRWQSHTGNVGLPMLNPLGYLEYRPLNFQFVGNASPITIILGEGTGSGPSRERYDVGAQQVILSVLASGQAADDFNIHFLGTNASNTFTIINASVGVASTSGETSTFASGTVDGGGSLTLGVGTTFSGALTINQASAVLYAVPATITASNGSSVTLGTTGLTWASISAVLGSTITCLCGGTITSLTLKTNSVFDKATDLRPLTVTNHSIDADTCTWNDPNSVIVMTNGGTANGQSQSGPYIFLGPKTVKIS